MGAEFPVIGKSFGTGEDFSLKKAMIDPPKFGQEKAATGNRAAKRAFESSSTRAAVKGPGGVSRGATHATVYEDIARRADTGFDAIIDEAYDPVSGKPTGLYDEGFSVGQEGKFKTRTEMGLMRGEDPKHAKYMSSEVMSEMEQDQAEALSRRQARAEGSTDPKEHYRRRTRAKKAHYYLRQINEEQKLLTGKNPNTRKSPEALRKLAVERGKRPGAGLEFRQAVQKRIGSLARRAGSLKNLSRKAGVLGVVVSPYTTGEALVGLGSKDKNEQLRSIETLNGLPEYSTGRGMTNKEKEERPVWHDPTTGEWKI